QMQLGDLVSADVTLDPSVRAIEIEGLTADSRAVERGFLFAALAGTTTDGARYVGSAVGRGAAAILIDRTTALGEAAGPVVRVKDPRRELALMAARFYPRQPERLVAVPGTSGKPSVAAFVRQIFPAAGHEAASIGTIGIASRRWSTYGSLTTPDPVALHAILDRLAREGVTHAA